MWQGEENPIEIHASNDHLALVTFRPLAPRFALYAVKVATNERILINTSQDVRRPRVSTPYLFWAEGSGQKGWEVRYEVIDE